MYAPRYQLAGFELLSNDERAQVIAMLVEGLVYANRLYLRRRPQTPTLYTSGVRFQREAPGRDDWQDIAQTLQLGSGDCEDLAAWRIADLRERLGEPEAAPRILTFFERGVTEYHVTISLPGGRTEDPSRRLGMP